LSNLHNVTGSLIPQPRELVYALPKSSQIQCPVVGSEAYQEQVEHNHSNLNSVEATLVSNAAENSAGGVLTNCLVQQHSILIEESVVDKTNSKALEVENPSFAPLFPLAAPLKKFQTLRECNSANLFMWLLLMNPHQKSQKTL